MDFYSSFFKEHTKIETPEMENGNVKLVSTPGEKVESLSPSEAGSKSSYWSCVSLYDFREPDSCCC